MTQHWWFWITIGIILGILILIALQWISNELKEIKQYDAKINETHHKANWCYENKVNRDAFVSGIRELENELSFLRADLSSLIEKQIKEIKDGQAHSQSQKGCQKDCERDKSSRKSRS